MVDLVEETQTLNIKNNVNVSDFRVLNLKTFSTHDILWFLWLIFAVMSLKKIFTFLLEFINYLKCLKLTWLV